MRLRVPTASDKLIRQVAAAVEVLRDLHLYKSPGVAESIDWTTALARLGATELSEELVRNTLGTVLKYREDQQRVEDTGIESMLAKASLR